MPAKAAQVATDDAPADDAPFGAEAQRTLTEAARRIEAAVQDGLKQLRTQSGVYADIATHQIEEAGDYVTEHVRARPLAATGLALGAGVLIGLLLASASNRD